MSFGEAELGSSLPLAKIAGAPCRPRLELVPVVRVLVDVGQSRTVALLVGKLGVRFSARLAGLPTCTENR